MPLRRCFFHFRLLIDIKGHGGKLHPAFILAGYAGTGKSSLTGALVAALDEMQVPEGMTPEEWEAFLADATPEEITAFLEEALAEGKVRLTLSFLE